MEKKRVCLFARKILKNNTRIFKECEDLVRHGYEVAVIGAGHPELEARQRKDPGYEIYRTPRTLLQLFWKTARTKAESFSAAVAARDPQAGESTAPRALLRRAAAKLLKIALLVPVVVLQRLVWFFRRPAGSLEYYYEAVCLFNEIYGKGRPDLIIANDLDTLVIAVLTAKRRKVPLLYDAQELYPEIHTLSLFYRWWLTVQEFILIRFADRKVAVNEFIGEQMEKRYRVRIDAVVRNCAPYEDGAGSSDGAGIRERLGIPAGEPVILYSGGLASERGIEKTLLALKYLDRGVMALLAEGPYRNQIEEFIRAHGLEKRVHFSAYVPHQEVPRFIRSADVGVVPYEKEGLNHYYASPSKLFHYLMAELPIATSDFPFLRKVVMGQEIGAVFDPSDSESIARAIRSILESKEHYARLKKNLKSAKRVYNWENESARFLELCRDLAAMPKQGTGKSSTSKIGQWVRRAAGKIRPLFVVGAGRSGTTLLVNLIGLHSDIEPIYETGFVVSLLKGIKGYSALSDRRKENMRDGFLKICREWSQDLPQKSTGTTLMPELPFGKVHLSFGPDEFMALTQKFLESLAKIERSDRATAYRSARRYLRELFSLQASRAGKKGWVNKVPAYVEHLDDLIKVFPDARIVHIVRDGRDVAASLLKQGWNIETWTEAAERWQYQVKCGLESERRYPDEIMRVRFEDLVEDPKRELSKICVHFEIPVEAESILARFRESASILPDAVSRWQQSLAGEDLIAVEELAGDSLLRCGYPLKALSYEKILPTQK